MKSAIVAFILCFVCVSGFGQPATPSSVTVTITVDGVTTTNTMTPASIAALTQFITDQVNDDGTPKYSGIADLLIKHVFRSLVIPVVSKYNPNVLTALIQAQEAQQAAIAAAATAAGAPQPK